MNIAFLGNRSCESHSYMNDFSENIISIAIMISLVYELEILTVDIGGNSDIWENNFNISSCCTKGITQDIFKEDYGYLYFNGLENILESYGYYKDIDYLIKENSFIIPDTKLSYISSKDNFYKYLNKGNNRKKLLNILRHLNNSSSLNFISINSNLDELNTGLLSECKLVAINISSCHEAMDIMQNMSSEIIKKCVIIINCTTEEENGEICKICKKAGIFQDNLFYIPDNKNYSANILKGCVFRYIQKGIYLPDNHDNFYLINSIFGVSNALLQKAGYDIY